MLFSSCIGIAQGLSGTSVNLHLYMSPYVLRFKVISDVSDAKAPHLEAPVVMASAVTRGHVGIYKTCITYPYLLETQPTLSQPQSSGAFQVVIVDHILHEGTLNWRNLHRADARTKHSTTRKQIVR